jgi:hypothetical protein
MPFTVAPVISRQELQTLNTSIPEQKTSLKDTERIDAFVHFIYRKVLDTAENTTERTCTSKIYSEYVQFYAEHLQEILYSLRLRLPGCDVVTKVLAFGKDGHLHESKEPSFTERLRDTYIVIDWS